MNECGFPLEFNPNDILEGGMMALWDDVKGGSTPWDPRYYTENPDTSDGFDPTFIMQHATDSANTAGALATGVKGAVGQMSQNLYEQEAPTLLEDARFCGKAGGVVSSVRTYNTSQSKDCRAVFSIMRPLSYTHTHTVSLSSQPCFMPHPVLSLFIPTTDPTETSLNPPG